MYSEGMTLNTHNHFVLFIYSFWSTNPFQALLSIFHGSIDVLVHIFLCMLQSNFQNQDTKVSIHLASNRLNMVSASFKVFSHWARKSHT